jgi:ribonuclease Z
VLGLPGMLKTFSLHGRQRPITVYGPPGLRRLLDALAPLIGRTTFEVRVVELEANSELERDGYRVAAFEVDHRVRAHGYALVEDERPGHLDPGRARELGVAEGPDLGRLQRGESVAANGDVVRPEHVLGPARRGRKIVLAGDTRPCEMTRAAAFGADLLVHEATFLEEDAERAAETGHSTARGAATLAADAEVGLLALTHLSPRYSGGEIRDEARETFERTVVPRDFDRIELPLPERGGPLHVRAE